MDSFQDTDKIDKKELFEEIAEVLKEIKDPRQQRKSNHSLAEVLFIIVSAMLTGANSLTGIMLFLEERASWLSQRLSLKNGFPSKATLWRIIQMIDPNHLQVILFKIFNRLFSDDQGQICFDGKSPRAFKDRDKESGVLNVVSAWATTVGIVLAQKACAEKSNEIPAVRELIEFMNIKGCTITADALHCQKETAELINKKGGKYLLALKGNQGILHEEAKALFDLIPSNSGDYEFYEKNDKEHGRIESRKIWVYRNPRWLKGKDEWPGLKALIMVEAIREKNSKENRQKRWYITSSEATAAELLQAIRSHWSIENSCHWCLDIVFDEDRAQGRDRKFAANMAAFRRFCLNILRLDTNKKIGLTHRRRKAAMNTEYLDYLWKLFINQKL